LLGASAAWAQQGVIDYTGGFATHTTVTGNGSTTFAPAGAPTAARLTPATGSQAGTLWFNNPVTVTSFNTAFTFQFTQPSAPRADGITFCIQNTGVTALGASGGAMGFGGIGKSVAISFKTYDGTATPNGYSNIVTNGGAIPVSNSIAPVTFQSTNIFKVYMTYDGTNLTVVLSDPTAGTSYTATYPINIATTVTANTAYVGFTGGTGGAIENQDILTWAYGVGLAPTNLAATAGANQASLSWTASPGASSYTVLRATQSGGPYTQIASGLTGTTYVDNQSGFGSPVYYVVYAVTGGQNSLYSNEASCTPFALIATAPTAVQVAESGGQATFDVTLLQTPTGQVTVPVTSANGAQLQLTGPGGSGTSINLVFPSGAAGAALTQTVTVTGVEQGIEAPPATYTVQVNFGTVTCTDTASPYQNYNSTGTAINNVVCTIFPDAPGIIVNPPSGLSTVNGGPPVTFTIQLATNPKPAGGAIFNLSVSDPNLATVSPMQITNAGYNSPVTVTVTPLTVNTQTTYTAPYDIIIDPSASTDPLYAGLGQVLVPIDTPVNLPPLQKVWGGGGGGCGLLGLEALLPLLLAAGWGRRKRSS
jgi:hypothetical protein